MSKRKEHKPLVQRAMAVAKVYSEADATYIDFMARGVRVHDMHAYLGGQEGFEATMERIALYVRLARALASVPCDRLGTAIAAMEAE